MAETKTAPALRLVTVNSDESPVAAATRTITLVNPDTGQRLDGVTATVRLMAPAAYEALEKQCRTPERGPRGLEWKIDVKRLTIEVLIECVESWTGVLGADGKPMPVVPGALQALDEFNKVHLAAAARTPAEVVDAEVVAASFRESAGVAGVAH
jgi:hypothetical protein